MIERISPASTLDGSIRVPGDKSISHRYGMLASIAEGKSILRNYSSGADCQSTLGCMRALGVRIEKDGGDVTIEGVGLDGLKGCGEALDAGNSGSTIRMLSGILSAQPFETTIGGDESLSRRPMGRIIAPLTEMGARIEASHGKFPPLKISPPDGGGLRAIDYTPPVASAQVKSCVLFAGIFADGKTIVRESVRTRDHSEVALREFGAEIESSRGAVSIEGRPALKGREVMVPGDLSSAAFFLVAALLVRHSRVIIHGVGMNPTRSALIDFLAGCGAKLRIVNLEQVNGELVGDILVESSPVRGGVIEKGLTAALIDEIPVLAVLGAASEEGLTVRDAGELRVKETDRIATVAENFGRMGLKIETREDGFTVPGKQRCRGAVCDSFGDHRIAMAFAVAGLAADEETEIHGAEAAGVSYPEFFDTLRSLTI